MTLLSLVLKSQNPRSEKRGGGRQTNVSEEKSSSLKILSSPRKGLFTLNCGYGCFIILGGRGVEKGHRHCSTKLKIEPYFVTIICG